MTPSDRIRWGFVVPAVAPVKRGGPQPPSRSAPQGHYPWEAVMMTWLAALVDRFEQALTDAMDDLTGDEDVG